MGAIFARKNDDRQISSSNLDIQIVEDPTDRL